MPIINFKEVPQANLATGLQDTFELFARGFLEYLGYRTLADPNRGADGGRDILVEETRVGVGGETKVRWLVSCKHKAHSRRSVSPADETNISDRLAANRCAGFIGVYSTVPSSGLASIMDSLSQERQFQIFDPGRIEQRLLETSEGIRIAERYFPTSIRKWKKETTSLVPNSVTTISGRPLGNGEGEFRALSVFDIIAIENSVEQTFWRYNKRMGVAELYCKTNEEIGHLANFRLSGQDCANLDRRGAVPDLWRYYEASLNDKKREDKWAVVKFQYMIDSSGVVSLYKINYAKCEFLVVRLGELLNDWDDTVTDG